MDRKPPRFNFLGKRASDNNDSLTTPIIDPNSPLSTTGPHFPSFDHHPENGFGQYLQELSQSVSDVCETPKQDKPQAFTLFPSPTTSSIPTPAIKYNHRHQQSQQSQLQTPTSSQSQSSAHQPHNISNNNHQLPNGSNVQSLNNLPAPEVSNKTPSPTPPSDSKSNSSTSSYQLSTSPSLHNYSNYLSTKQQHGGSEYVANNSSHLSPIPVTVITTGLSLTASATTTIAPNLSRINQVNQRLQHSSSIASSSSLPTAVTSLNLSNHSENNSTNTLSLSTEDLPSSSSRSNHINTSARRRAPFSPVSTISTSSQASTVGKESAQYIVPSGSEDEQTSRATPGRKKKMDPTRRSKLTKKEKLDRIINEEKRLQASNSALKQRIKVMQRDFNILQNFITNILIEAAKYKRNESLQPRQEGSEDFRETSS
ncbi:kinesin-related protein 9-like [Panonychus citri]|uniref:kinesin-related protein 9-like n=1 Tax=Panonychus citri TaxID=50023 RepID=UPI002307029E|nr:kinesin-related protein 9-like [Panonychus citri]XP_053210365.1 kinesin-related protein 9-like [Panonychus citri]XP_053210367.1 kinesin-related protein 9-like [Panonychus citri]